MSDDIEAQLVSIRHELLLATITGNRVNLRIRELLRREHDLQAKLNSQLVDAILAPIDRQDHHLPGGNPNAQEGSP